MNLILIEKNTVFYICEASYNKALDNTLDKNLYKATFHDIDTDVLFFVESEELYHNFQNFRQDSHVEINFSREDHFYTFAGKIKDYTHKYGAYLLLIEQISPITSSNRRIHPRNPISTNIQVYELSENDLSNLNFMKAANSAGFSAMTLDISAGGLCIVSNTPLPQTSEPYFLLKFNLEPRENKDNHFLLPAKLLRRGNCPQTTAYNYDYGFIFLFSKVPQEKDRLVMSLFNARLEAFKRL